MNIITERFRRTAGFFRDVGAELRKGEWPGRSELVESTVVVLVAVALLGVFVGFSDFVLIKLLELIIPRY